jgi:hypothetical protein
MTVQRSLRSCSGSSASSSSVHGTGAPSGHATSIQFSRVQGCRVCAESWKSDRVVPASSSLSWPIPLRWFLFRQPSLNIVPHLVDVYVTATVIVPRTSNRRLVRRSLELRRKQPADRLPQITESRFLKLEMANARLRQPGDVRLPHGVRLSSVLLTILL